MAFQVNGIGSVVIDPLVFVETFWPDTRLYKEEVQILESVRDNKQTFVPAANKLGKDFTSALAILWFFLTRHPCRIVTTSAKEPHLEVLWGEILRFIQSSTHPKNRKRKGILDADNGGPLAITHHHIKKLIGTEEELPNGRKVKRWEECPISYVIGMVAGPGREAAMGGHHATPDNLEDANDGVPRTMFVSDESSSVPDVYFDMAEPWAMRFLIIGNTWECNNAFYRSVKGHPDPKVNDRGGDIPRDPNDLGKGYLRKVIRITAAMSPNVRLGLAQVKAGKIPTNEILIPGVKSYQEYVDQRRTRDPVWQCVALDAEFYEGSENLLYPPEWLNHAEELYEKLRGTHRNVKAIGVDPGWTSERKSTCLYAVDEFGIVDWEVASTPNTALLPARVINFARRQGLIDAPECWLIDLGGGGKQLVDRLEQIEGGRYKGVRGVGFGESLAMEPRRGLVRIEDKVDAKEERYTYENRRAQMYGELSIAFDPDSDVLALQRRGYAHGTGGFAMPRECQELRRQLARIPRWYNEEGRLYLPPKNRKSGDVGKTVKEKITMHSLIGCSPDEADALVLAVHGLLHKKRRALAGGF